MEKEKQTILCAAHGHCPAGEKTSVVRRRHIQVVPGCDLRDELETQPALPCVLQDQLPTSGAVVFARVDGDHDHAVSPRKQTCCARTKSLPRQPRASSNAGIERGVCVTAHPCPTPKCCSRSHWRSQHIPVVARGPVGHVEALTASLRTEPNTIEM